MKHFLETVHSRKSALTPAHFIQSGIAGVYILIVYWLTNALRGELTLASLCASAFIVFRLPHSKVSRARVLIGAYCTGALCGLAGNLASSLSQGLAVIPGYIPGCAVALSLTMLFMLALKVGHPPAAAFAASVTLDAHPAELVLAGLGAVMLLCVIKTLLKRVLRDL